MLTAGCPPLLPPDASDNNNDNDNDLDWSSEDPTSSAETRAAAADLYASLAREEDSSTLLGVLLARFAAVAVIEDDGRLIDESETTGVPVFADFHPEVLADGFGRRMMVSAESFFESLEAFLEPRSDYPGSFCSPGLAL